MIGEAVALYRTILARLPGVPIIILVLLFALCPFTETAAMAQSVLLVHDAGASPSPGEKQAIGWACDLLGHFGADISVLPVARYQAGDVGRHRATIFLGLRPGVPLPDLLLADCERGKRPLCWIGAGVEQLTGRGSQDRYGFLAHRGITLAGVRKVFYKDAIYRREATDLPTVTITKSDLCQPVAIVEDSGERRPYAVRSGRLWYFPELPLTPARGASAHLVLCDQMHEVVGRHHDRHRTGLVYIAGVTPGTDAGLLSALVKTLQAQGVPFGIEVAPIGPTTSDSRQAEALAGKRRLVSVLRGAQRAGASIIAFLREPDATSRTVLQHGNEALDELARCGLYPIAWSVERRRYAGEQAAELGDLCSTLLDRGAEDVREAPVQMPFAIASAESGQGVMPGNLPVLAKGGGEVEAMLDIARRQTVVSDPWVTAGIAVGAPPAAVSLLIGGLQDAEFSFHDLRFADNYTRGESLLTRTVSDQHKLRGLLPRGWGAMVLGPETGDSTTLDPSDAERLAETTLRPGAVLVGYPRGRRPAVVLSLEGDAEQVMQRAVQRLAQLIVMLGLGAAAVLLGIYLLQLAQKRGR